MQVKELWLGGLGVGLVLAGVGATVFWLPAPRDASQELAGVASDQGEDPAERVTAADMATLKAEIERLKGDRTRSEQFSARTNHELSSLRSRLAQLDQKQDSIIGGLDRRIAAGPEGSQAAPGEAVPELTPEEELEREAAQTQAQIEFLDRSLFAERIDPAWADSARRALDEALQNEKMSGLTLVSQECRTTLCRLELHLDGSLSPAQAFHNLAQHSQRWGAGFVRIDNAGSAVVYLAKEGHSLPPSR